MSNIDTRKVQEVEECLTVMLDGLKAFFEGRAVLYLEPQKPGIGHGVRFVRDVDPAVLSE